MSQEMGPRPPTFLPDALAGLADPTGSPDNLYERSTEFSRAATQLDDIGGDVSRLVQAAPGPWEGPALQSFHSVMRGRPQTYRIVAEGYRKAGGALKDYASALENAQSTYAASRKLCGDDEYRQFERRGANPATPLDLFSVDRIRARRQLEVALERLRASTVRATAVLKGLESTLGDRPPVKPEIYRGRSESMMQAGSELAEKGKEDLRAWLDLRLLVRPGESKRAWGQAWDEFYAEMHQAVTDPLGYLGDEAYAEFNVEEAMAGNDARWVAGMAYTMLTRKPMKIVRWFSPDGKRKQEGERDEKRER